MLTPSTSHLWTKCALSASFHCGSTAASGDGPFVPDDEPEASEARREGVAADWIANGVLRGDAASAAEFEGEAAPNGWIVTPDMVTHVQGYINYCNSRAAATAGGIVRVQSPVSIPQLSIRGRLDTQIVTGSSTASGTADAPCVLEIISLKYGWRIVEAEWNAQLLCEAIALFDPEIHDRVTMTVYQPRPAHPDGKARHWEMDEAELTTAYYWLAGKAQAATSPSATGTPGGGYCRDCNGRGRCEALAAASYTAFEWVRGAAAMKLDAAALGDELKFLDEAFDLIKARRSGVKAEVEGRMKRNEYIPQWMWDIQLRDREFTVSPEEVQRRTGIEAYKQVAKSPAEMEKEGANLEIIDELTTRRPAGPKLVPATRAAIARCFKKPRALARAAQQVKSHGSKN